MAERPSDGSGRHHRPALFSDLTELIDAAGGSGAPGARAELAAATAAAVVHAGRGARRPDGADPGDDDGEAVGGSAATASGADLVGLADRIGLETLAALWRDADPVSLPGALWALYLLRQWCHTHGDEVTRLWRAGEADAPADAVVAGVPAYAQVTEVQQVADAVLGGVYTGDLAVALERAAALFRVVAAGRRRLAADGGPGASSDGASDAGSDGARDGAGPDVLALAERNERVAADLAAAAARWRAGTLH